jgi:hypothetical protein
MPYCRKCGAELADEARFCPVCGTPVASPVAATPRTEPQRQPVRKAPFPIAAIILIAILIFAVVAAAVVLLPFQPVNFNQQNEASAGNVNSVYFNLEADIANINVHFRDLPADQRVQMNTTATGWRSILGSDRPLTFAIEENPANGSLIYIVKVLRAEDLALFHNLNVTCEILIDPSIPVYLNIRTSTGNIELNADKTVTLTNLDVEAATGSIDATLSEGVVLTGTLSLRTATGSTRLVWNNADVSRNTSFYLRSSTSFANLILTQNRQLAGNVTINVENSYSGFLFINLNISKNVGASISNTSSTRGVQLQQNGFSGDSLPMQSNNYPSQSNFAINLQPIHGETAINAVYELGGTRS